MAGTAYYDCDNQSESLESVIKKTIAFQGGNPYIRVPSGFPFISDLIFDYDTRTGLNLIDNIAGETALIRDFTCADFVPANLPKIDLGDRNQFSFGDSVDDSAFWVSAVINMDDATNFRIALKFATSNVEWQFMTNASDQLLLALYDNTGGVFRARRTNALTAQEGNWIHVLATYDGSGGANAQDGIDIYVENVVSDVADITGGAYTAMHNTTAPVTIGYNSVAGDHADGRMYDVRIGSGTLTAAQRLSIFNEEYIGSEIYACPDGYSGIDISGNSFHGFTTNIEKGVCDGSYLFDNGFSQMWDNIGGEDSLQLPYDVNGNPVTPHLSATVHIHNGILYTFSENHPTDAYHNLSESYIGFNEGNDADAKFNIFDRRNVTIFNATARAGFYDGTNRITGSRFHISELGQFGLGRNFYNIGWAGRHFIQGTDTSIRNDRFSLDRIFVYGTDKVTDDEITVLTFTNDITHGIPDGLGSYVVDGNGYVVLTQSLSPFPIAFTAGYQTLYDAYGTQPTDAVAAIWDAVFYRASSGTGTGEFALMDKAHIFASHDPSESLLNILNPGTFDATTVNFVVGDFLANSGWIGDGATKYMDFNWIPSVDGVLFTQNNASYGGYSQTDLTSADSVMMGAEDGTRTLNLEVWRQANVATVRFNSGGFAQPFAISDSRGMYVVSRNVAATFRIFQNGNELTSSPFALATNGVPTVTVYGWATNNGAAAAFDPRRYSFMWLGGYMTPTNALNLHTYLEYALDNLGTGAVP